jgi:hypothetical protein
MDALDSVFFDEHVEQQPAVDGPLGVLRVGNDLRALETLLELRCLSALLGFWEGVGCRWWT